MWSDAREIAPGDLVIVWQTRECIQPLVVTPGKDLNSRFGYYRHNDLIGLPYGSKVGSRNGKGFIHVLRPTPELWTLALPHRTQILYLADIAFITSWLDIRRGSHVIEAGTGSGSFSHAIARTIGTSGHLYSYEFHEARAEKARQEFIRHGMQDMITLTHRNVCKDGFTVENHVDAVFLDLPAPWDAIPHAKNALRKDGPTRICCFSPCVEQVLRTVHALNEAGFTDVTMYETLLRPHEVHPRPAPRPLSEVITRLKGMEKYREEKRLRQIARAGAGKRKREVEAAEAEAADEERVGVAMDHEQMALEGDGEGEVGVGIHTETEMEVGIERGTDKRPRVDTEVRDETVQGSVREIIPPSPFPQPGDVDGMDDLGAIAGPSQSQVPVPVPAKLNWSKVSPDVRGHTSYLTFARLVPMPPSNDVTDGPS